MKHTDEGKLLTGLILNTFKLNGLLINEGDKLIKDLGLTSARWKVLGALFETSGALTVPEIARMMGQSRQAVQRLSNEMKEEGLVETQTNPDHKRAKKLVLSENGKAIYALVMHRQIPWVNSIADQFEASELELASSVLQKLICQFDS